MNYFRLDDEQFRDLLMYLNGTADDADDNGAEDHAARVRALSGLISDQVQDDAVWDNDTVQFARLLAEINANIDIKQRDWEDLLLSMDLDAEQVNELFDRAGRVWERSKTVYAPRDFRERMASYIRRGLDAEEILNQLDPDTAGVDLIELVKTLMAPGTVYCKFCHRPVTEVGAHRHQDGWVGECCWDERLRSTE